MIGRQALLLAAPTLLAGTASAQVPPRDFARRAAIHPVATVADMRAWLGRVPVTRTFPPDFAASLRGQAPLFTIEMTTAPGCVPFQQSAAASIIQYFRHLDVIKTSFDSSQTVTRRP